MGCWKDVTHTHASFKDTTAGTHQLLTAADEILLWDEADGGRALMVSRDVFSPLPSQTAARKSDFRLCFALPDYNTSLL